MTSKASLDQTRVQLSQSKAVLVHQEDILNKTTYRAPIDGIVTYLPSQRREHGSRH